MRHSTRCVAALALSITAAHVPAQSTPPSIRALTLLQPGDTVQFERTGYFCVDPDSTDDRLVFNRTTTLRDSWAKIAKKG